MCTGIGYSLAYIFMTSKIGKCLSYLVVFLVWVGLASCTFVFGGMAFSPATFGVTSSGKVYYIICALVAGLFFIVYNVMLYCGFS
jgi:hypothetical protein